MGFKLLIKRLAMAGLLAAILWTSWQIAQVTYQKWRLNAQVQELKKQAQELEAKNQQLEKLIQAFQNPALIELEAKKRFNLKRPGENVIVVLPEDQAGSSSPDAQPSTLGQKITALFQKGHLPQWWEFFFGSKP